MMERASRLAALTILLVAGCAASAGADELCRPGQTDPVARPAPPTLLLRLSRTFGVAPDALRGGSYVRCAGGRFLGCMVGANLNCGRADVSRRSAGAEAFCRANPGSDVVPMAATGHDTVYDWHCVGAHAVAGATVEGVDRMGFTSGNWRLVR